MGLTSMNPSIQALAPYLLGRLLCGHRACPSHTLYGDIIIFDLKVYVK